MSQCDRQNEGEEVTDRCGRSCFCENGRTVDCCYIRKDFTSMTPQERERYVRTVKTARCMYRRRYNKIISTHSRLFMTGIHQRDQFLPWHRWYLLKFEKLLQKVDCKVTLPYWDWSLFSGRPWEKASFWAGRRNGLNESIWSSSPRGLGGDGNGKCVKSGPFSARQWKMTPSAKSGCIKRKFHGKPFIIANI